MDFVMSVNPEPGMVTDHAYMFVFCEDRLLVINEEETRVPEKSEFDLMNLNVIRRHFLGTLDGRPCYTADLDAGGVLPAGAALVGLREIFGMVDDDIFSLAAHAVQIVNWDRMHQYCGRCGTPTGYGVDERAKICGNCGAVYYPRISPAIIVAVKRDNKLLLLRNKMHKHDFYSVLAGFVEPGESLEQCLVREAKEEVGIEVKNIKYFASQSWPFPSTLMVGFTADYAGGELCPDGVEIDEAGWFAPDNLPKLPGSISIARKLIDAFVLEETSHVKNN
jgi:NAD+ diphosphatase